jgi:hypothetical protein
MWVEPSRKTGRLFHATNPSAMVECWSVRKQEAKQKGAKKKGFVKIRLLVACATPCPSVDDTSLLCAMSVCFVARLNDVIIFFLYLNIVKIS